jgi:c-di-GMP-binding flagellar brake protein YcgR
MEAVRSKKYSFAFHIWERLQLTIGEEGSEGTYSCRLSDIEDDRLIITRPHFERGNSLLADNRIVRVFCARADAVYSFSARIKEIEPKQADQMYLLELGHISRVQRRRFVRLDKVIQLKYMVLPRPISEPVNLASDLLIDSKSHNLSAGGLLIAVDEDVDVEDLLVLAIVSCDLNSLPGYLLATCRHIRTDIDHQRMAGIGFILQEDLPRYLKDRELKMIPEAAIQFDDRTQNKLVAEIFAEQLIMRQKGLI